MPYLIRVGLLFAAYFLTAKFGLTMDAVGGFATLVWPPTGIALAALLIFGLRLWPGIALGAFAVNLLTGAPLLSACGIAAGNTLEAVIGVYLVRRVVGFQNDLARLSDVMGFIGLAALLSTALGATMGVASLWIGGGIPFASTGQTWMAWWIGDVLGALVVAPLLLTWSRPPKLPFKFWRIVEALGAALLLILAASIVYWDLLSDRPQFYSMPYIVFPFVIWVAFRFGPRGTSLAIFTISTIAIWGTVAGHGPFRQETLSESLYLLQSLMGVVSVTALILAASISEISRSERWIRSYAVELETANRNLSMMIDVLAHDLKEPLRSVENFSQRLTEHYPDRLDERGRDYLRRIDRASRRMRQLIGDVLRLSQVKQKDIQRELVSARTVVSEAVERLESRIRESRAAIHVQNNLPNLHIDRILGVEAVYNLISNAIKFTADSRPPDVQVAGYDGPEGAGLVVRDRGPGVDADLAGKIFKMFERGVGREVEGTGAGLAIVQQVAERHGGKSWVRPREGGGSEFIIAFGNPDRN